MTDKEKLHQILSSLWKNDDSVGKTYYNQALQDVQTAIDLQEEPAPKILEDMLNAITPAESLGISAEEHDRIVDELIYGKEPELVDIDDLPNKEEEHVSIWHDASEIPEDKNWVLLTHRDGWYHVGRLYEGQHGNLVISDGVSAFKLCEFKRWVYIDDLLKL